MPNRVTRFLAYLVLTAAAFSALRTAPSHATQPSYPHWSSLLASMDHMHTSMSALHPSGDVDADFARLMLPHHQAALDMAATELLSGKDPQMRRLAQEIVTDQQSEMDLMHLWLAHHPATGSASQEGN